MKEPINMQLQSESIVNTPSLDPDEWARRVKGILRDEFAKSLEAVMNFG
jgi:hypothetical protein